MGQQSYYNPWQDDDDGDSSSIEYDTNASMIEMHLPAKLIIGMFATVSIFLSLVYMLFIIELDNKDNVIVVENHGGTDDLKLSATSSTDEESYRSPHKSSLQVENGSIVHIQEDLDDSSPGGPTKKFYIQNDTKMSLAGTTGALTLLCYLLLVALPETGHFILSVLGFLMVMGIFLKSQIKSQIRTDRYDRIATLFTLVLFLAASLCLATYAGIALNEGTIYQGNARIIGFSESDYSNENYEKIRRTDLMVSWGDKWGCPGMDKTCYAEVKGSLCEQEERRASRRLDEGEVIDPNEVDILAEDYVELIELSNEPEQDDDEFYEEEMEVVENLEEDLEVAYYEASQSNIIEEEAEAYADDVFTQTLVKEELVVEIVETEAIEAYYEAEDIISSEQELNSEFEEQVTEAQEEEEEQEEQEEEKNELEEELEELEEEFEELKEELREENKEEKAEDEEILDEAFDAYYDALENEYEVEENDDDEVDGATIIELDEELEDMANNAYYEAIKNEELEDEVEALEEELLDEEELEEEEEIEIEIYYATYSFEEDDAFDDDYWNQNWSSTWGDFQCNDLFNYDLESEEYDTSVPPGDDDWPFINIYGKCNTCDAYIVDYFSTEHFQSISAYQEKGLRFGIAGLISFALTMLLVYRQQRRPENERQSELLENGDGVFS